MTRKDYLLAVSTIQEHFDMSYVLGGEHGKQDETEIAKVNDAIALFSRFFSQDNSRFDPDRFRRACLK